MHRVARNLRLLAGAAALISAPLLAWAAAPAVAVAPLHSSGAKAVYPRLTTFPDARIMAKVNALLATREKDDRGAYADCLSQLKDMKMKPDKDTYSEDIAVRYLSGRLLSIEVVTSYDCAGAYPTNGAETPATFDLASGNPIDWTMAFKPGFLPGADEHAPLSFLTRTYRSRYSKAKDDADCRQAINQQDPFSGAPIVWLDARGGVVFQPDFPHVLAACATPLTLPPGEIAPWLKDARLAADLKAAVRK
ncbi:MAG TPA: hypothetical protein VII56_11080 [Rhizomicrobium sp.]